MKLNKELLIALLVGTGLYNAQNSELFVQNLDAKQVDGIIEILKDEKTSPAIRVAAATKPNSIGEDNTNTKA